MKYTYKPCHVTAIISETDMVKRFFFKVDNETPFDFKPGQFIMFNLPLDSKYTNRSYSIASPPYDNGTFELVIVLNPKGLGTPFLWDKVEVGTELPVSKALGKFSLHEPIIEDLCFIGTGTGIAPLRSMILHIYRNKIPHKNIYLIFGNRWEKDILYRKEMEDLAAENKSFHFIPVLSRENPGWKGKQGYVHAVYEDLFKNNKQVTFYLCGWRDMLVDARQKLEAMGYSKKHVRFESFD